MTARRSGFTLVEVLAVMTVLVILAAILAPSLRSFTRDTKVQAASDLIRGRIADARGEAMEHGRPYRLAVSQDGKKVRIAPDDQNFDTATVTSDEIAPMVAEDALPKDVTATSQPQDGTAPAVDADGWTRVVTFQPDGTCREDAVVIRIRQPNMYPIVIRIRGLTGAATVEALKTQRGDQP